MRSESPEECGRQKPAEPPSYRIENEYNPEAIPQYFQISVGVLEGRNFTWLNSRSANSYVVVQLGKKKCRSSIRRNKQEPHYKEYFAFGIFASVYDLQRSTLNLSVMEPRCCAAPHLLGEANISLGVVWRQPYFQAFRKWMQLSLSRDPTAGSTGFLKVDISITCRSGVRILPTVSRDSNIEVNYLLTGSEEQHANYIITIHGVFGLPNTSRHQSERHHSAKPPNTFVRVLFCGLQAKTAVQKRTNNPMYNEQVSMVEMFPSSNPVVRFEICSTDSYTSRLLASKSLNLDHISHDGENGFLPTFGPSLLPIFGSASAGHLTPNGDSPFYRGSLLISLRIAVPYYQQSMRSISVEPVVPISVENLWTLKTFCIFCPIFEVSMLDSRLVSDFSGVAITIGEIPTEFTADEDLTYMMNEMKTRKLHYTGSLDVLRTKSEFGYLDFSNTYPVLQSTTQFPDYRFRIYRNNVVYRIVCIMKSALKKIERRLQNIDYTTPKDLMEELNTVLEDVANNILQYVNNSSSNSYENLQREYNTELDKKQHILQIEEMKRIREKILQKTSSNITEDTNEDNLIGNKYVREVNKRSVKCLLSEAYTISQELDKLIFKATEGWSDLVIWLLNDGSRVGFCKISVADIIYSTTPEECGSHCGRIQSIYFKPLKCLRHVNSLSMGCFCDVGKVELLAWMGLHEQSSAFEACLPNGYKLKIKDFGMHIKCNGIMVECRVFIYKARLLNINIDDNSGHVYLRIYALNTTQNSKAIEKSSTPVWNQLLRIKKMMYTSSDRLLKYPPVVLVEMNCTLSGKTELIGSFQVNSVIEDSDNSIPKLRWCDMYKGMENTGKVLISVQIVPVPETLLKSTLYTTYQECYVASDMQECENSLSNIELLPTDLIPKTVTYKLDIYWWGIRNLGVTKKPCAVLEIEDLIVKSDIIIDKRSNCNFVNGRVSQIFETSFNERFLPSINVKLYDNCTFGRILYIGKSIVKNPNKLFIQWYSKMERETSVQRASVVSTEFVKVSQTLCVKKKTSKDNDCDSRIHSELSCDSINNRTKQSFWRKLFSRKEPDEEEYTLLPTVTGKSENKILKKTIKDKRDWWNRYACSQKENNEYETSSSGDKFIIYESELEQQPQFSKFKDWCVTMKLYNDEKIGITAKDEELQCGRLKVGIAIYKWPPQENIIAVSANGVELNRGFFHEYPNNDRAKFLVRAYLIKGINLKHKNISAKPHPFVIIRCGSKQLGDRCHTIPNTSNPVFGTVYELRCTLPEEYQLTISLYNHDPIESDELIGSTTIDLENRIYTKHRASVGLASEYSLTEAEKWRDCIKPSVILEEMCMTNHLPLPSFPSSSTVMFNGVEYKDNGEGKEYALALECRENICLSLLHNWDNLPICGYPLVPEHVETRTLYNPENPGIEQGKIHMWIDIFPINSRLYIPPPVDITPRKTEEYELKLTIIKLKLFQKEITDNVSKITNLYVKVWTGFLDHMQNTDCHSVSPDDYFIFNWCMKFSFNYDFAERKLVKKDRNQFTDFEQNVNPELQIQVMDSDSLSFDEPIGSLVLNLNEMSQGEREPKYSTNDNVKMKMINLFSVNTVRAWWLLKMNEKKDENIVGAIKLEVSLLPKQNTLAMPVGLGNHQFSSMGDTNPRLQSNELHSDFSLKNFFYKHNALWGSLTGSCFIILSIVAIVYFVLFTL